MCAGGKSVDEMEVLWLWLRSAVQIVAFEAIEAIWGEISVAGRSPEGTQNSSSPDGTFNLTSPLLTGDSVSSQE